MNWDVKTDKIIVHASENGLMRMTEVRWTQGPCVAVDGNSCPPRVYMIRKGKQRDITNLLQRLAERKPNSV